MQTNIKRVAKRLESRENSGFSKYCSVALV